MKHSVVRESPAAQAGSARREIPAIALRSIVSLTPDYPYSNEDIATALGLKALPRVCRKIGIESRKTFLPLDVKTGRVIGASENFELEIAAKAGEKAIKAAGISRQEIGVLYFISCTAQKNRRIHFELASHDLVRQLRLDPEVHRFEADAGCDGFVRALHLIRTRFKLAKDEHALVIVTSMPSLYFDRRQCSKLPTEAQFPNYVFGDGAAAAVIAGGEGEGQTIGVVRSSWSECDPEIQLGWTCYSEGDENVLPEIAYAIDYKAVASSYVPAIERAVKSLPERKPFIGLSKVDRVYFHQANGILPLAAADALGIPHGKLAMIAHDRANLAAASVPTMLAEDVAHKGVTAGNYLLLAAVGAGLSCSAALLES